ncbi:MAG TPA: pyrrolo-quinoline quinone, partial [Ruminiclostridium sp.]
SPVDFKSSDGKTYVVFCDFAGNMHLIDPMTGETLDTISLGRNVEASPAIYNDTIVVGSYAQKIFGIKVK